MNLMSDQCTRTVSAVAGRDVLLDPRQHRAQVVLRLLANGVSAATLRAIVPEWSALIAVLDEELHGSKTPVVHAG